MENFVKMSYERQARGFDNCAVSGTGHTEALTWLQEDTVDYWRHARMYTVLDPILKIDRQAAWLTVGDGRFGKDAKYILNHGCSALPTDLTDVLLKESVEMGYIPAYKKENAERLSFDDDSFDYVFCKESYHHFPRPFIALYEMLRVARKGVVLVEPNDGRFFADSFYSVFLSIVRILKSIACKNLQGFVGGGAMKKGKQIMYIRSQRGNWKRCL